MPPLYESTAYAFNCRTRETSFKRTVRRPNIDSFQNAVGTGEIGHDLCLEKTPEKGEVKYGAAIGIWKIQKTGRARLEPLLACTLFLLIHGSVVQFFVAWIDFREVA